MKREDIYFALGYFATVKKEERALTVIEDDWSLAQVTNSELHQTIVRLSAEISQLGDTEPVLFSVCVPTSIGCVALLLAVLKNNAANYIDPDSQSVSFVIQKICPKYIIVEKGSSGNLIFSSNCNSKIVHTFNVFGVDYFLYKIKSSVEAFNASGLAYVVTTSGSTGTPKIVHVPWDCILPNISDFCSLINSEVSEVFFSGAPFSFDPSFVNLLSSITNGVELVLAHKSVLLKFKLVTYLIDCKVSLIQVTGSFMSHFNAHSPLCDSLFSDKTHIKTIIYGGEPAPSMESLNDMLRNCSTSVLVFSLYGITEVSCWASVKRIDIENGCDTTDLGDKLSNTALHVVDQNRIVLEGEGEIYIGREKSCAIFHQDCVCSKTVNWDCNCAFHPFISEVFSGNIQLVPSGDRGVIANGKVFFAGRSNKSIKLHGEKVFLNPIENYVKRHVGNCVCVNHGTKVILFIQNKSNCNSIINIILNNDITKRVPMIVHTVDQLPLTSHGKIDTTLLIDQYQKQFCDKTLKQKDIIERLWKSILLVPPKPNDSFLQSGGNSLKAILLLECLRDAFGRSFDNLLDVLLNNNYSTFCSEVSLSMEMSTSNCRDDDMNFSDMVSLPKSKKKKLNDPYLAELILSRFGCYERGMPTFLNELILPKTAKELWTHNMVKCIDGSPVVVKMNDGRALVFASSHSGLVSCLNIFHGDVIWQVDLHSRIEASICCNSTATQLFIGSYSGIFYCLNLSSGEISWTFKAKGELRCSAVYNEGHVYFGCHDKFFYCLNDEGTLVWKVLHSGGSILGSPCIHDDFVYVACLRGTIAAYCKRSGIKAWKVELGAPIFTSVNKFSSGILVGCVDKHIHAFSYSGVLLWKYQTSDFCYCTPTVITNQLTVTNIDSKDIFTNSSIKSANIPKKNSILEVIVFGNDSGDLYFIDKHGKTLFIFPVGGRIVASPFLYKVDNGFDEFCCVVANTIGKVSIFKVSFTEDSSAFILEPRTLLSISNCGELFSTPLVFQNLLVVCGRNDLVSCYKLSKLT